MHDKKPQQLSVDDWITVGFDRPILTRESLDRGRTEYVREEDRRRGDSRRDQTGRYPVLLDLSQTALIGFDVLPRLGALLKHRVDEDLATRLRLPLEPGEEGRPNPVIDYLQTWHFGQFIERITERPFESFLDDQSCKAWSDWTLERSRYARVSRDPEGEELVQMSSQRYVRLTAMRDEDLRMVTEATDPNDRRYRAGEAIERTLAGWTRGLLRSIFDQTLVNRDGKPAGDMVGTTILAELLINSLIHSSARLIYTYGQFSHLRESSDGRGYFVLSVWDNAGDEKDLGKQLWGAISADRAISPAFGKITEVYHIWGDGHYERSVPIGTRTTAKEVVRRLVDTPYGATVAGITSEPGSLGVRPRGALDVDRLPDDFQGYAGLGLHRVKLAALVAIDGVMEYAGSTLRTTIRLMSSDDWKESGGPDFSKVGTAGDQYRVDRRQIDKRSTWPLAGNLWTVWLPVRTSEARNAFR